MPSNENEYDYIGETEKLLKEIRYRSREDETLIARTRTAIDRSRELLKETGYLVRDRPQPSENEADRGLERGRMSSYRCYFMIGDRIVAREAIEAAGDAKALLKASELLSTSRCTRIEVWQRARVVGSLPTPLSRRVD